MLLKITLEVLALFIVVTSCVKVKTLGGKWLLDESGGKYVNLEAQVPGGIYSDLMKNGVIGDIFFGYNDNSTKWVSRSNWTYHTNFTVDDDLLSFENINIVFEGLDTFASILINDVKVGESQNMFVQYIFNIKSQLKSGVNKIEVRFQSPIEVSETYFIEQNKAYNVAPDCVPQSYKGECHINMIRKMQASYSWDWGPAFPSVGIWKDLFIEAYNGSTIRYVVADTVENGTSWILNIDTYFASNIKQNVTGTVLFLLSLPDSNLTKLSNVSLSPNDYNEIVMTTSIEIPKNAVNTWWPNGYGGHDLYNLSIILSNDDETEISIKHIRIGFRTVELVQDALDTGGLTFYFKVNGVPMFMKGANEVPIDILPERGQNKSTIKQLLTDAHDTHMNMLRVWGGGVYESDYFYDLADELGILILQDCAFASALYPATDKFLNNVLDEIRHQIKRLVGHPSLTLVIGNNENEGVLAHNMFHVDDSIMDTIKKDYVKLYIDTIGKEFDRLTHKRGIFLGSSESNGKKSADEGYLAKNPWDELFGDDHFYNIDKDPFDPNMHPIPRFISEYGSESLPSVQTLLTATNNTSDLNIDGDFMNYRQHHPKGNQPFLSNIAIQFELPDKNSSNYDKIIIYYTQIRQAMWTKIASERYRSYRSYLDDQGRGYTMGALYWMLNDVWVAPSWASIDFTGKWKMLHYYTAEFFAPIIITGHIKENRTLLIYTVSDLLSPMNNVTALIQVYKWDSFEAISVLNLTLDLEAGKSQLIQSFQVDDYLTEKNCGPSTDAKHNCFIYLSLNQNGVKIAPDNFILPAVIKDSKVQKPKVQIESVKRNSDDKEIYEIEVSTDKIALFVWLDSFKIKGKFSENGFLQVNKTKVLYFYSDQATTTDELLHDLTITNLLDK